MADIANKYPENLPGNSGVGFAMRTNTVHGIFEVKEFLTGAVQRS